MKAWKAARLDGIPNEAWKSGAEGVKEWAKGFYNRVWIK